MWLSNVELQDLFGEMQNSANLQDLNDPVTTNNVRSIAPVLEAKSLRRIFFLQICLWIYFLQGGTGQVSGGAHAAGPPLSSLDHLYIF